jgi:hypothetical protein
MTEEDIRKNYYEEILPTFSSLHISQKIRLEKDGWRVICNPTFEQYASPVKSYYCSEILK